MLDRTLCLSRQILWAGAAVAVLAPCALPSPAPQPWHVSRPPRCGALQPRSGGVSTGFRSGAAETHRESGAHGSDQRVARQVKSARIEIPRSGEQHQERQ